MPSADFNRVFAEWKQEPAGPKRLRLRNALEKGNLRLVAKVAFSFVRRSSLELNELIAAGSIGLISALEHYDPENGASFATYGPHWIKQAIRDEIHTSNLGKSFQIPVNREQILRNLRYLSRVFQTEHGRYPSAEELSRLAQESGKKSLSTCTPALAAHSRQMQNQQAMSLDTPANHSNGEGKVLSDVINANEPDPFELTCTKQNLSALHRALSFLSDSQRRVLKLRFGLDGEQEHTLEELGNKFGLSRERIRQIEARALSQLKRNVRLARSIHGI